MSKQTTHNNNLLYMKIDHKSIQTNLEANIDGKNLTDLIPIKLYNYSIVMLPAGVGTGSSRDNTNKRYGAVRVVIPMNFYNDIIELVFSSTPIKGIDFITTSIVDNSIISTFIAEFRQCFIVGSKSFNGTQFNTISKHMAKHINKEFEILENLTSKQGHSLEWFKSSTFSKGERGVYSPGLEDVVMVYLIYTSLTMKANVISGNVSKGQVGTTITRT